MTNRAVSYGHNRTVEPAKVPNQLVKQPLLCFFLSSPVTAWRGNALSWRWWEVGGTLWGARRFPVCLLWFPFSSLDIYCGWCQRWTWPSVSVLRLILLWFLYILQQKLWKLRCLRSSSFSQVRGPGICVTDHPAICCRLCPQDLARSTKPPLFSVKICSVGQQSRLNLHSGHLLAQHISAAIGKHLPIGNHLFFSPDPPTSSEQWASGRKSKDQKTNSYQRKKCHMFIDFHCAMAVRAHFQTCL